MSKYGKLPDLIPENTATQKSVDLPGLIPERPKARAATQQPDLPDLVPETPDLPDLVPEQYTPAQPVKFAKQTIESAFPKSWRGREPLEKGLTRAQLDIGRDVEYKQDLAERVQTLPIDKNIKAIEGIALSRGRVSPNLKKRLSEFVDPKFLSKIAMPPPEEVFESLRPVAGKLEPGWENEALGIDKTLKNIKNGNYDVITAQDWGRVRDVGKATDIMKDPEAMVAYFKSMSAATGEKQEALFVDLVSKLKGIDDVLELLPPPPNKEKFGAYLRTGYDKTKHQGTLDFHNQKKAVEKKDFESVSPHTWKMLRSERDVTKAGHRTGYTEFLLSDSDIRDEYARVMSADGTFTKREVLADLYTQHKKNKGEYSLPQIGHGIEAIAGAPFRVAGGFAGELQKKWQKLVHEKSGIGTPFPKELEPEGYGLAIGKSVVMEDPKYLMDVFQDAARIYKGSELTTVENIAAGLWGLGAELAGPGQMLKLFRLGRGGPQARGILRQINKASRRSGLGKLSTTHKDDLLNLLVDFGEAPNRATGLRGLLDGLKNITRKAGLPKELHPHFERQFIKQVGTKAQHLGETGFTKFRLPVSEQRARMVQVGEAKRLAGYEDKLGRVAKLQDKLEVLTKVPNKSRNTLNNIIRTKKKIDEAGRELRAPTGITQKEWELTQLRDVPLGGERVGLDRLQKTWIGKAGDPTHFGIGTLMAGRGGPKGLLETMRPARGVKESITEVKSLDIKKAKKLLDKSDKLKGNVTELAKEENRMARLIRSKDLHTEYESVVGGLESKIISPRTTSKERDLLKIKQAEIKRDFETGLERSGVSKAEAEIGYVPKNEYEAQAYNIIKKQNEDIFDVEHRMGVLDGSREMYSHMSETEDILKLRKQVIGKSYRESLLQAARETGTKKGFLSVGATGTGTREFIPSVIDSQIKRLGTHANVVAGHTAEQSVIAGARELTDMAAKGLGFRNKELLVQSRSFMDRMAKQNLTPYKVTMGKNAGKVYLVDSTAGRELERFMNPARISNTLALWHELNNWWKAAATIMRPGFLTRNVAFGNMTALWQADVNMPKSLHLGAKAMYRRSKAVNDFVNMHTFEGISKGASRHLGRKGHKIPKGQFISKESLYTLDEAVELGVKHAVDQPGWMGKEVRGPGAMKTVLGEVVQTALPLNQKFFVARGVRSVNSAAERYFHWALYMGKIEKGYTAKEASQAVAKYLFYYDEYAQTVGALKEVSPFIKWSSKNKAMQIADLYGKPDKVLNFLRATQGIPDIDPVTGEIIGAIPDWMKVAFPIMLPWLRGKDESRVVTIGDGVFPIQEAVGMLEILENVGKGELKKGFGRIYYGAIEQFQPMIKEAIKALSGQDPTVVSPYTLRQTSQDQHYFVPTYIKGAMDWAKDNAPKAWEILAGSLFEPSGNWELNDYPDYKWSSRVAELVSTIIPQVGVINRFFRDAKDSEYKEIIAYLFGVRFYEMTEENRNKWLDRNLKKEVIELDKELREAQSLGVLPKKY